MKRRFTSLAFACATVLFGSFLCPAVDQAQGISIQPKEDRILVTIDGEPFTEYVFTNTSRPFCYPVYGPGQVAMTRNWPMKDAFGEAHDHPHHKGLWYSHGAVNGIDFWSEASNAGSIRHQRFLGSWQSAASGGFQAENEWVSREGKIVCTDRRRLTFQKHPTGARIIDFEITLVASHGPITLGDTKEGAMAIRVAESMRLKGGLRQEPGREKSKLEGPYQGKGTIVNSKGERDNKTWGRRAEWCAYVGPVGGKTVGVAILNHPSNPRHPTWWHVRDYGLFAANPFGKHDFESLKDAHAGDLQVAAGSSVTFKYRFYFFRGDETSAFLPQAWKEFSSSQ